MVTKFASLATASALLLTAAPAAVAETIIGDVRFCFNTIEGPIFFLETTLLDIAFDDETGIFAAFESAKVQMSLDTGFYNGPALGSPSLFLEQGGFVELTITIEEVPTYGPMEIELGLVLGEFIFDKYYPTWDGEFAGAYGPPMGFGEPVSVAGNWTAQVVPAPGVASLLALTGLARRRRRD
jgi:hypothetical protein